jgi:hypothetical protein
MIIPSPWQVTGASTVQFCKLGWSRYQNLPNCHPRPPLHLCSSRYQPFCSLSRKLLWTQLLHRQTSLSALVECQTRRNMLLCPREYSGVMGERIHSTSFLVVALKPQCGLNARWIQPPVAWEIRTVWVRAVMDRTGLERAQVPLVQIRASACRSTITDPQRQTQQSTC